MRTQPMALDRAPWRWSKPDDSIHESVPPFLNVYASVRDAKDWENPCLVIRRDGIEVIAKRFPAFERP
jgi:hypothetical protein